MYISNDQQTEELIMETMNIKVPCVNMSEIMQARKGMSRWKTGGAACLSINLPNDGCKGFSKRQTRSTLY